ncbi:MAG: NUDIX hydrolase [Nanoarchaeota archaeon]|nr:NUDIX hydrolase [Nanoarchaeota archaeon]
MKISNVAIILPYNKKKEILFQDRRKISKHGEEYGFFGGHIEEGETPEQTLKRELKEELDIEIDDLQDLKFFKQFNTYIKDLDREIRRATFLVKMNDLNILKANEGKAIIIPIEKSFDLKMNPGDADLLKEIYKYIKLK